MIDGQWNYLHVDAWQARHALARHYTTQVARRTVEVGAFHVPVHARDGWLIDPLGTIPDGFHGTVADYLVDYPHREHRAVIALGICVEGGGDEWDAMERLCRDVPLLVVEWAVDHATSTVQGETITAGRETVASFDMVLPDPQLPGYPAFCRRRLVVAR